MLDPTVRNFTIKLQSFLSIKPDLVTFTAKYADFFFFVYILYYFFLESL